VQTEVNAVGKKIRVTDFRDPKDGENIVLTIDSELQKYVYDLLSREKAGACAVIDISGGEVLALVSVPAFDPNLISGRMTRAQWEAVAKDPLFPLMNRAVECSYPPGSIFKIIVAFAALSEGVVSPQDRILCVGGVKLDDRVFHCWNRGGHGKMNLCDALKFSCDCYFFEVARKLGINAIIKYAQKFGFGSETGVEIPNENVGLLPTKQWKFLRYKTSWKPYETMLAGIGQGALLATLMQAAVMMGKLYSVNYDFRPTLIKGKRKYVAENPIDPRCAAVIINALNQVCESGTASGSCRTDYGISGKTGSSQVRTIKSHEAGLDQKLLQWKMRDHAFFVGCAPQKNPRYVVAVLVEHGGGGAYAAAPVARKIFDRLMKK
jgi:penicillin-binding protein 2